MSERDHLPFIQGAYDPSPPQPTEFSKLSQGALDRTARLNEDAARREQEAREREGRG